MLQEYAVFYSIRGIMNRENITAENENEAKEKAVNKIRQAHKGEHIKVEFCFLSSEL